jgi:hypothetical protein
MMRMHLRDKLDSLLRIGALDRTSSAKTLGSFLAGMPVAPGP